MLLLDRPGLWPMLLSLTYIHFHWIHKAAIFNSKSKRSSQITSPKAKVWNTIMSHLNSVHICLWQTAKTKKEVPLNNVSTVIIISCHIEIEQWSVLVVSTVLHANIPTHFAFNPPLVEYRYTPYKPGALGCHVWCPWSRWGLGALLQGT